MLLRNVKEIGDKCYSRKNRGTYTSICFIYIKEEEVCCVDTYNEENGLSGASISFIFTTTNTSCSLLFLKYLYKNHDVIYICVQYNKEEEKKTRIK